MRTIPKFIVVLGSILLTWSGLWGCSDNKANPIAPGQTPDSQGMMESAQSNRVLWGIWEIYFDESKNHITINLMRDAQAHFNVTDMLIPPACDDCLNIQVNSFDPLTRILDADVTLRNPTQLSGYDVRGILYTDDFGHELRNADDWTGLWDIPGGQTINPFKAFAKSEDHRISKAKASHTEKYLVYIPQPPHYDGIKYACDASWPGNCGEPYEITNFVQETILDTVGSAGNIYIDIYDWQGDVDSVAISIPGITGEDITQLAHQSGDTWIVNLVNNTGAKAGDYTAKIIATSAGSGTLALCDFVTISITEYVNPFNPSDVTPLWLNMIPYDIYIDGNYAYIAGGYFGLHIFDISDPQNPKWVSWVNIPGLAYRVVVCDEYAYVGTVPIGSYDGSLFIVDITPPGSAYIFNTVDMYYGVYDLAVSGGYAYIASGDLLIVDIDPPESGYVMNSVALEGGALSIALSDGYAYAAGWQGALNIVDIDPPESAYAVNTIQVSGDYFYDIEVSNGYAYIPQRADGLRIIDIDPPESAYLMNTVDTPGLAQYVDVSDGLAYIADLNGGLQIVDIDPPESASIAKTVSFPGPVQSVVVSDGYGYVVYNGAFSVVDIDPYDSTHIVSSFYSQWNARKAAVSGEYAYAVDHWGFMTIIDVDQPESAFITKAVDTEAVNFSNEPCGVVATGGYAYLAEDKGLQIIDVDPSEDGYLVNAVELSSNVYDLDVSNGYAYVANGGEGLQIIDVSLPESAYIVNTVETTGWAYDVAVSDGYACVADGSAGLIIVDVDPPEAASIINTVDVMGAINIVAVSEGYAYVTDSYSSYYGLTIVDIEPPQSASIVKHVPAHLAFTDIVVEGGYAYLASWGEGLTIIDVNPPDSAYIVNSFDMKGPSASVAVSDGYAYLVDSDNDGLRIVKLW